MTFSVKFDEHNPLYKALVVSKCRLDLSCFPTEAVDEFFEENFEYDYEAKVGKERNESKSPLFCLSQLLRVGRDL